MSARGSHVAQLAGNKSVVVKMVQYYRVCSVGGVGVVIVIKLSQQIQPWARALTDKL